MPTTTFVFAKLPVVAEYRAAPHNAVRDGGPAGLGEVLIDRLTFGGVEFTKDEAEALQFGNDETLWDQAESRCWQHCYGPATLRELRAIEVEVADAARIPEFARVLAAKVA